MRVSSSGKQINIGVRGSGEPVYFLSVAICLVSVQVMSRELGELALWITLPLVAWIVLSANPKYLSVLLVFYMPVVGFAGYILPDNIPLLNLLPTIVFPDIVQYLPIGIQLNASLVTIVMAFIRTTYELINKPSTYKGLAPNWIFFGWFLSLIIAIIAAVSSSSIENNVRGWSVAIRVVLTFGGFFWGIIIGSSPVQSPQISSQKLRTYIIAASFLCFFGILAGQAKFLLLGLGAAIVPEIWKRESKVLSSVLFVALFLSSLSSTLTSFMIFISCFVASLIQSKVVKIFNPKLLASLVVFLTLIPVVFTVTVFFINPDVISLNNEKLFTANKSELGFDGRLESKLLGDRAPIWIGVFNMISNEPYLIVPPGRNTEIEESTSYKKIATEFTAGAHNTALEIFRQLGLVAGFFVSSVAINAVFHSSRILFVNQDLLFFKSLALGLIVFICTTASSNHYLASEGVGFLTWSLAGYLVSSSRRLEVSSINHYEE